MGRTPKQYRKETYLAKLFNKKGGMISVRDDGTLREKACRHIRERLECYELPETDKAQQEVLDRYLKPLGL